MMKPIAVLSIALLLQINVYSKSHELDSDLERGNNYKSAQGFKKDVKEGRLRQRTNKAVEALIKTTLGELRKGGANLVANQIQGEYERNFRGIFLDERGVGDHEGVEWLLKVHATVESVLSEDVCRALRLHDLWTLAHTIPVVFNCIDNVDAIEYMLHFIPFSGIVSYWVSVAVCMGATIGTGVGFACGFIGMGIEMVVTRFVAPPLSQPCWKKACKQ